MIVYESIHTVNTYISTCLDNSSILVLSIKLEIESELNGAQRDREREGEREREKSKGSRKEEAATLFSVQHSQAKHSACRALPLC